MKQGLAEGGALIGDTPVTLLRGGPGEEEGEGLDKELRHLETEGLEETGGNRGDINTKTSQYFKRSVTVLNSVTRSITVTWAVWFILSQSYIHCHHLPPFDKSDSVQLFYKITFLKIVKSNYICDL